MKTAFNFVIILVVTFSAAWGAGSATCPCDPRDGHDPCAPVGGWNPYGGGVLGWWPCCNFPCCGGPDDYCRKPLPNVCWPKYSPFYKWYSPCEPSHCDP